MKVFDLNTATRHWLWAKKMKLVELERLTGMTRQTLTGVNGASPTGKSASTRVSTCEKIAAVLNIELIEFIESGIVDKE